MRRDIVWECVDRPGLEHLVLTTGPDGASAEGLVVADLGHGTLRLHYALDCDAAWRFSAAVMALDAGRERRRLMVMRGPDGTWTVDGEPRPDLAGCTDLDIMATPFTNTLPIRRLAWAPEERHLVRAAYVALPDLTVAPAEQAYTRLGDGEPRRFRYEGLGTGFSAELTVDLDGVVIDYPPVWRRRAG